MSLRVSGNKKISAHCRQSSALTITPLTTYLPHSIPPHPSTLSSLGHYIYYLVTLPLPLTSIYSPIHSSFIYLHPSNIFAFIYTLLLSRQYLLIFISPSLFFSYLLSFSSIARTCSFSGVGHEKVVICMERNYCYYHYSIVLLLSFIFLLSKISLPAQLCGGWVKGGEEEVLYGGDGCLRGSEGKGSPRGTRHKGKS